MVFLIVAQIVQRQGLERVDVPILLQPDLDLQHRAAEQVEGPPCEILEAPVVGAAEEAVERERRFRRLGHLVHPPLQQLLQLGQGIAIDALLAEIQDRLDRRDHLMGARLRQQGAVVPAPR